MKRNIGKILGGVAAVTLVMTPLTLNAANWMQGDVLSQNANQQQPIFVQANSAQLSVETNQLREQVRDLNGRVEELTFQLLQMQEQLRKMQEDNEFRFQELEDKQSSLEGDKNRDVATAKDLDAENMPGKSQPSERNSLRLDGTPPKNDLTTGTRETTEALNELGQTGRLGQLGSLIFDKDGNLIKGSLNKPPEHQKRGDLGDYSERLENILAKDDPILLYKFGRDQIQFGDYILAAETFNVFLDKYSEHELTENALFWLGESYLLQEEFEKSAQIFVRHHREYSQSPLGADALLNLGISMAGLDQRQVACATFAEVPTQYPDANPLLLRKLKREQKGANCL